MWDPISSCPSKLLFNESCLVAITVSRSTVPGLQNKDTNMRYCYQFVTMLEFSKLLYYSHMYRFYTFSCDLCNNVKNNGSHHQKSGVAECRSAEISSSLAKKQKCWRRPKKRLDRLCGIWDCGGQNLRRKTGAVSPRYRKRNFWPHRHCISCGYYQRIRYLSSATCRDYRRISLSRISRTIWNTIWNYQSLQILTNI